jgi:cholest-4-en-3-one 26-monooxygenase
MVHWGQEPLMNIDIFDPDIYGRGVPHDAFRTLRAEAPVYFHAEPQGRGYWAISKYDDIVAISKNPETFSSARGGTNIEDYPDAEMILLRTLMINMDPPQHVKFRRLVTQGFTPRMIARMEEHVRDIARTIVDDVVGRSEGDFVSAVAAELPLRVITEMMGIPEPDRAKIYDWSNRLIGFDDPEFQTSREDGKQASMEMWMYANQLAVGRKGKPDKDLVSVLINAEVDGHTLSEMEFDSFFLILAVAGNETTRNLISGGMLALLEHPAQFARLRADRSLVPTAVEEMLRWVTPVMHFRRTATRATEIRGQAIAEGDKVVLLYPSANRDEDVFPDGDVFDVARTPNEHLAFGIGQHSCLGLNLARLEVRVMFEEILARLPDLALAGAVRRLRSNFINGYKEIPVRFRG